MADPAPKFTPGLCANCDSPAVTAKQPLFCSQQCRQAAELVRYVRSVTRDGRIAQADVREAVQMRMAMVLGGGYPEQTRQVPDKVRAVVFERSGGRCESCGRELDFQRSPSDPNAWPEIHHAHGHSNDPEDLRAWCRRCNMGDAQAKFTNVEPGSPHAKLADELRRRWEAPYPLRVCDNEQRWASMWRQLAHEARASMKASGQRRYYSLPMLHECGHSVDWAVDLDEHDQRYLRGFIGDATRYPCPWCGSATGLPSDSARDHEGPGLVRLVANEVWYRACPHERLEDARRNRDVALRHPTG